MLRSPKWIYHTISQEANITYSFEIDQKQQITEYCNMSEQNPSSSKGIINLLQTLLSGSKCESTF